MKYHAKKNKDKPLNIFFPFILFLFYFICKIFVKSNFCKFTWVAQIRFWTQNILAGLCPTPNSSRFLTYFSSNSSKRIIFPKTWIHPWNQTNKPMNVQTIQRMDKQTKYTTQRTDKHNREKNRSTDRRTDNILNIPTVTKERAARHIKSK